MWQRKQTLFLLGSLAAIIVCLLLPIGAVSFDSGLGSTSSLTNLGWSGTPVDGMPAWPLFALATIAGILSIVDIFLFKNRKLQMKLCGFGMFADFLWYVYYVVFFFGTQTSMHVRFAACLPLISCIFLWLAKKGIKSDDDLVKSMDRIR